MMLLLTSTRVYEQTDEKGDQQVETALKISPTHAQTLN